AQRGARTQRLLWASTSTKNPRYRDVLYVEELIGPDTVDTVPPATLDAFRDHGRARPSLEQQVDEAEKSLALLERVGGSLREVTDWLVEDGVRQFADAFDKLLVAVERQRQHVLGPCVDRQSHHLPPELDQAVTATLEEWRTQGKMRRLAAHDASLWTGH